MKFERIEPINKIKNDLFVRHKVEDMKEGELIQRCIICGGIIEDYSPKLGLVSLSEEPHSNIKGSPAGYLYVNKSGSSEMRISEMAIESGFCSAPKEFIDCNVLNS